MHINFHNIFILEFIQQHISPLACLANWINHGSPVFSVSCAFICVSWCTSSPPNLPPPPPWPHCCDNLSYILYFSKWVVTKLRTSLCGVYVFLSAMQLYVKLSLGVCFSPCMYAAWWWVVYCISNMARIDRSTQQSQKTWIFFISFTKILNFHKQKIR